MLYDRKTTIAKCPTPNWPKISVVTPCLNQADFLPLAIESILAQKYPNLEYIIIDGGSTDGSQEIIKSYESHIDYWHSCKDGGQADAINKGFLKVSGDIVAWLNADDLYLPGAFEKAAQCFSTDPKLDLLYGDCVFIDKKGQFIRYFTECEPYNPKRLRNSSDFIMQPTTFFKRNTLFKIGLLDTSLHYTMDWDLWARFAKAGAKVKYLPLVLAANREYSGTKTNSGGIKRLREIFGTNLRNMTGVWPNAFFSFTAFELYRKVQCYHPALRFYGCLLAQLISALSLNRLSSPKPVPLYGLYPHSHKCTHHPEYFIPYYEREKPRFILIEFSLNESRKADIEVGLNGINIYKETIALHGRSQLKINIDPQARPVHCYHVTPRFWVENRLVKTEIYKVKLLR